ncbi:MAG: ABC transporter ATP-binding protein [Ancrocorticia sp.]
MTTNYLLEVSDLSVTYRSRRGIKEAVRGANLTVAPGEITAIVGESGSGKTTLARAVVGLLPSRTEVRAEAINLAGRNLRELRRNEWFDVRGADIGWIPQDPTTSLNPMKRVGETVAEALRIHKWKDEPARRRRVLELLERVGLDDPELRATQYPHELSGGMRQRVLIASALALRPKLIIADEPTSALDVTVQKKILDLIDELRAENGSSVLLITHDLAVAGERADHIVVMENGRVREEGDPLRILTAPRHAYTKKLISDAPSFSGGTAAAPRVGGEILLRVKELRQEFRRPGKEPFVAVDDVSFEVTAGTTHGIVGESGSGKTTTGRAIAMFHTPTSGSVELAGRSLVGVSAKARREYAPLVQLVSQNPRSALDPRQTIEASVAEPLRNYRRGNHAEIRAKVAEALDRVGLPESSARARPAELSGGQLQRVAIARALVLEPELVIFDEAVSALDVTVQAQILRLLEDLQRELGLTYLFISHDLAVIRQIAQTVSVLQHGKQVEVGETRDVLASPQHPYTRELISAVPRIPVVGAGAGAGAGVGDVVGVGSAASGGRHRRGRLDEELALV